jgi:hypothetical protein
VERIDTGLTKDTDLTRHSNKYKNSPIPLGEEFRKPTKDDVRLVGQLSLLPNIILTGRDPDKITKATVELVNELRERVEDWSILWVDARSVASIQKSYVQILETLIGTELRDGSGDEISRCGAKALFHYLSWTYEGLWIMVFDGLEAEGAIYLRLENMFPRSCAGTLIISTTDPTSAQLLGLAEVIQLPEADASFDRNRDKYLRLHSSFRDFLLDKYRSGEFWVNEKEVHQNLAARCIQLMSQTLRKDICEMRAPSYSAARVESSRIQERLPPEVQYACLYWVQHLHKSGSYVYDSEEAHQFLQAHLLHWLEALGWMGKTSEGIQAILSLEAHVPVSYLSIIYKSLTCP